MKSYKGYILILASILFSCNDKDVDYGIGEYRVDLVKVIAGNTFSMLDEQETLLVSEQYFTEIDPGSRILLNYSQIGKRENGFSIKINGGTIVHCDTVIHNSAVINKLGNDPISLETAWSGLNYLNISCYVDYYSNDPIVALILDGYDGQTCRLSFRYDKRDDPAGSRRKIISSFDLSNVLGMPIGEKAVEVTFREKAGDKIVKFDY